MDLKILAERHGRKRKAVKKEEDSQMEVLFR